MISLVCSSLRNVSINISVHFSEHLMRLWFMNHETVLVTRTSCWSERTAHWGRSDFCVTQRNVTTCQSSSPPDWKVRFSTVIFLFSVCCSSLPELLEKKRLIDLHTNVATAVLDHIKVHRRPHPNQSTQTLKHWPTEHFCGHDDIWSLQFKDLLFVAAVAVRSQRFLGGGYSWAVPICDTSVSDRHGSHETRWLCVEFELNANDMVVLKVKTQWQFAKTHVLTFRATVCQSINTNSVHEDGGQNEAKTSGWPPGGWLQYAS